MIPAIGEERATEVPVRHSLSFIVGAHETGVPLRAVGRLPSGALRLGGSPQALTMGQSASIGGSYCREPLSIRTSAES